MSLQLSALWLTFSLLILLIEGANIIFLGLPIFSHLTSQTSVARELHKLGHNCYLPVPKEIKEAIGTEEGVKYLPMEIKYPEVYRVSGDTTQTPTQPEKFTKSRRQHVHVEICDDLLMNEHFFQMLKSVNASLFVIDGVYISNCFAVFPYRLSTPFILMGSQNQPNLHRTPWLFSVFPHRGLVYSDRMSFLERFKNMMFLLSVYFRKPLGSPKRSIKEYAPEKPFISFDSLLRKADLHIIENDALLDYPLPALPNVKYIGGIKTRPAKPLIGDLGRFANASKYGLVVVSFGSMIRPLPDIHLKNLEQAFTKIPYDVIWKRTNTDYFTAPNVFTSKWLPQNDVLGHKKVKLFITHCGSGGQYDSLYHGVPMLGFPIWADQPFNGRRMQEKGYGISMDLRHYTADELVRNINKIIQNPKYKNNIQKASRILKSAREHPPARAARHIDNVIKFGGGYLRSYCQDIPLYQYFMLDIFVVTLFVLILGIFIAIFILRKALHIYYGKKTKED